MKARFLTPRQGALKALRQARDWAASGHIREGRTSIKTMLLDSLEDAYHWHGGRDHTAMDRAMEYVCMVLPRHSDPGSRSGRTRKIALWNARQYVTQNAVVGTLQSAVDYAILDIRKRKEGLENPRWDDLTPDEKHLIQKWWRWPHAW